MMSILSLQSSFTPIITLNNPFLIFFAKQFVVIRYFAPNRSPYPQLTGRPSTPAQCTAAAIMAI